VLAATADYYFIQPKRRFFVGAGVGDYTLDEQLEGTSTQFTIQRDELLGIMVRTGFEEKHIRVSVEYHFVEDAFFVADNNYLGLQVAYFWGGGKKKSNLRRE
jgi:outer membrane protein W